VPQQHSNNWQDGRRGLYCWRFCVQHLAGANLFVAATAASVAAAAWLLRTAMQLCRQL